MGQKQKQPLHSWNWFSADTTVPIKRGHSTRALLFKRVHPSHSAYLGWWKWTRWLFSDLYLFLFSDTPILLVLIIQMVLKTRRPNIYCRDAHVCRQQEQMRGQRQSSYTPNSATAAGRNWRRQLHSSCRLDSQCSGDRDEEEEEDNTDVHGGRQTSVYSNTILDLFLFWCHYWQNIVFFIIVVTYQSNITYVNSL